MRVNYIGVFKGGNRDSDSFWEEPDWNSRSPSFLIEVGATDERRWQDEKNDGHSGADARTHVCAILSSGYDGGKVHMMNVPLSGECANVLECAEAAPILVKIAQSIIENKNNYPGGTCPFWGKKLSDVAEEQGWVFGKS